MNSNKKHLKFANTEIFYKHGQGVCRLILLTYHKSRKQIKKDKKMMKETIRYFVVPKSKIADVEYEIRYHNGNYDKYINLIEDYEIQNLTEQQIKSIIKEYNLENDKNVFNKYKISDFVLVKCEELKDNKVKARQIRHFELSK